MSENKPRDEINELAEKYVKGELSFHEAFAKAVNVTEKQNDFKRLLEILNTSKDAPKTKGCQLDNSL